MRLLSLLLLCSGIIHGAEPPKTTRMLFAQPQPQMIVQRVGFDPVLAAKQEPGAKAFGYADVPVRAVIPNIAAGAVWEYRTLLLKDGVGAAQDWTALYVPGRSQEILSGLARVKAGGMYRLEIRGRLKDATVAEGAVEPIGVGEVFVVAGQSYATNCNDERLKVTDAGQRVTACDTSRNAWQVAHDPQPVTDNSDGGSTWPPLGDALAKEFRVPVGFVNVAVGATSSVQWLPDGKLHQRLLKAGQLVPRFRAVLWQQGESDVIAKTTTADYVKNLKTIRHTAATAWKLEVPWLLAKSTHHPTVYNDADGEGRIRAGTEELTKSLGFAPGPDTDTLKGENRGDAKSRRHFSALGQKNAAGLWFDVLKTHLATRRPVKETIADLHLDETNWGSPLVYRESSVLLQMKPDGPITARLAFPARDLLDLTSADGYDRFPLSSATLDADGRTLTFKQPVREVIKAADLFPPANAPNSYKHRVGKPDQNLLYRPGRWFHDHNIEVTYRRRDFNAFAPAHTLKALDKAKAGTLRIGISGDSISTGLDSSATANAPPYQPGYPDLVSAQLEARYHQPITLKNRAVSGWSVANGVADLGKLLDEKPNLIVIAYGMNDVGRRDPAWFGKQTRMLLERIHAADKTIEVILVAPMLGHAEWIHTPRDMFAKYRDELKKLTGDGVYLADLTAVWDIMLRHKHDLDLTGNGLNHPNDFGHRLYAQAILEVLQDRDK